MIWTHNISDISRGKENHSLWKMFPTLSISWLLMPWWHESQGISSHAIDRYECQTSETFSEVGEILMGDVFLHWQYCWCPGDIRRRGLNMLLKHSSWNILVTLHGLTHWGRDKMAAVSQTTLSNAFSSMKMLEFWFWFHWSLFLRVQLTIIQHWFR